MGSNGNYLDDFQDYGHIRHPFREHVEHGGIEKAASFWGAFEPPEGLRCDCPSLSQPNVERRSDEA